MQITGTLTLDAKGDPEGVFVFKTASTLITASNSNFRVAVNKGIETKSVLEPTTIIAMIVYALIAYAVVRIIEIYKTPKNKVIR